MSHPHQFSAASAISKLNEDKFQMKKQTKPSIKAHLIPSLFILLSIITIGVIPFAQAQHSATKGTAPKAMPAGPGAAATKFSASRPVTTGSSARVFRMGNPPSPAAPNVVLYDQYNNSTTTATLSATFTDFPTFSADLADDFVVPSGQTWNVSSIDADGQYFNGPGPATSWNVYIYANNGTLPGATVYSILNTTVTVSGTTFTVNLSPCATLTPGTYWVEIQANMTFGTQGEWGWTDRTVLSNNPAAWQNTGGGFGICPTWAPKLATCVTTAGGPDQVYRLNGTINGTCATPTPTPTATPTPTPCPNCGTYVTSTSTGTVAVATTDTGNHCDDCSTAVALPFSVSLYGVQYNSVNVVSNGAVDFVGTQAPFTTGCVTLPSANWTTAVFPYDDDLRTDIGLSGCTTWANGCGIFTSVSGTAPNRQFHIVWQTVHFADNTQAANFELRLYEGCHQTFDVIYGATNDQGSGEFSGVQASATGPATQFSCGIATLTPGLDVTYTCGATPTPTPTPTPACNPWTAASPYPVTDVRYGFAQTGQYFYVFGGVSNSTRINNVNRLNRATGMWEARAPMPFTSEAPTCALMASTGIVYCAEGDTGTGFASYNLATDTWATLANTPNATDNYGSASGAFNGKVFLAGGTTSFVNNVWVYDVGSNTWTSGTPAPDPFLLAGYTQVGQYLYLTGGWTGGTSTGLTTTRRLDMTVPPGVWQNGPAFPMGRADFGLAYDAGKNKLYALGGDTQGGGFFDSTNEVDELDISGWPAGTWNLSPPNLPLPNRQANQAGFSGAGAIWSVGGINGQTFQFLAEVWHRGDPLHDTVYVGVGGDYASLTNPGDLFDVINTVGLSNNLDAVIVSDINAETGAIPLYQWIEIPCPGGSSQSDIPESLGVTIRPGGLHMGAAPRVVTGSATGGLIRILAGGVTINGSLLPPNGADRSLTIQNVSTNTPTVVLFGSVGVTPIQNDILKNCIIIDGINTSSAVVISDGNTLGGPGYFNNITIQNNSIQRASYGVYANGGTTPQNGSNLMYVGNDLSTAGANAIRFVGLYMQGVNGALVSGNNLGNFNGVDPEDDRGIWFGSGTINATANANRIHDLNYIGSAGFGGYGVAVSSNQSSANDVVSNNMIYNISGDGSNFSGGSPENNPFGIYAFGPQTGVKIYFNSINLFGNTLNQPMALSAGIALGTGTNASIVDNIIVNNLGRVTNIGYGSVGTWLQAAASQLTVGDYNLYLVNPSGSGFSGIGQIANMLSVTLPMWRTATGMEMQSLAADPLFLSNMDLHIACGSPAVAAGTPIPGITTDFDNNMRSPTTPTIGAVETCTPGVSVVSAVSRKVHGGSGTFDIPLSLVCPSGVECRSGGNYTIVVTFSGNETVTSAAVTCHNPGSGTGIAGAVSGSGTPIITVPLTGVSDAQTLNLHITGTTSVDIPIGFLIGDTNGNGTVNAGDIAQTKSRLGQTVNATNFRSDVNVNGTINAADTAIVKAHAGISIPSCCP
jgi:hypothetical protein